MELWMVRALELARLGAAMDEVPVGAVVVLLADGKIIGEAHDEKMSLMDPTAHAEILAMRRAALAIGDWRLENCALVVTLEPCAMCAGAALLARVPVLVYGAASPKFGAVCSRMRVLEEPGWNHRVRVVGGVCAEECGRVLSDYFQGKRRG
jgi:tRNA(adenine34) deaminase